MKRRHAVRSTRDNGEVTRLVRPGFTMIELLVVIAIITVLLALTLPAFIAAKASATRHECRNRLRQIALGFEGFEETFRKLPTYGDLYHTRYNRPGDDNQGTENLLQTDTRRFGWGYQILPWIQYDHFYNFARDPDRIEYIRSRPIPYYVCPGRWDTKAEGRVRNTLFPGHGDPAESPEFGVTHYAVNAGTGHILGSPLGCEGPLPPVDRPMYWVDGAIGPIGSEIRKSDITSRDGTSYTLLLAEPWYGADRQDYGKQSDGQVVGWMGGAPDDPDCTEAAFGVRLAATDGVRIARMHSDGRAMLPPNDTTPYESDGSPAEALFLTFGGPHPSVCNVAFCDGNVEGISRNIDGRVWLALATRNGGEIDHNY